MKRLMISAFVAIAVFAAATTILWPHSPSIARPAEPAGLMSLQELHSGARVNNLPIEDFEDQSLVYSTAAKR
jgi:hypothetical protein